jgi:uncharacterized peroxidase-related enzyme
MSRIAIPAAPEAAPAATHDQLAAVGKQLGGVPNLFRLLAVSPAALSGFLGLSGGLAKGSLRAATREAIALRVAELNGCDYCLAAHSQIGRALVKVAETELSRNRAGTSDNSKTAAILTLAGRIVATKGHVADADVAAAKLAGVTEAEVVETVLVVAENILTNYLNSLAKTPVDFPAPVAVAA